MTKRVLVLLSSANKIPLREGGYHNTGIFLGELVEPMVPFMDAGYIIDFVSPDGKSATIDDHSYDLMYWGFSKNKLNKGIQHLDRLKKMGFDKPMNLDILLQDDNALESYDLLFVPGGHGPMTDLLHEDWMSSDKLNSRVGKLLTYFKIHNKITALICHAPAILASAIDENGTNIYEGYEVTCVTRLSEFMTEDLPPFKAVQGHLRKYPEDFMKSSGIKLKQKYIPMLSNVIVDRNLITGQDPYSAEALGIELMKKLSKN